MFWNILAKSVVELSKVAIAIAKPMSKGVRIIFFLGISKLHTRGNNKKSKTKHQRTVTIDSRDSMIYV